MRIYSRVLVLAAAFALLSSVALAGAPAKAGDAKKAASKVAGKVVAVRGAVSASKGGAVRRLRMKAPIYTGDTITSKRGRIQIMFTDKTLMNLGPNSQLVISKYLFEKGKKPVIETKLKEGVLRVMGGKIAKQAPKNFKVKTPTATIGIRGSMFGTSFRNGVTLVVHLGGKGVDVSTKVASVPLLRPQEGTYVRGSTEPGAGPVRPEPPKKLPLVVLDTLIGATAVAGTDEPGMLPPPPLPPPPPPGEDVPPGAEGSEGGEEGDPLFSDMFWDPTAEAIDMVNGEILAGTQSGVIDFLVQLDFEGYFVLGLVGPNTNSLADDEIFRGLAEAINDDGDLHGTAIGGLFDFKAGIPPMQLKNPFTHFETKQTHVTWKLLGKPRTLPMTYAHDNLGQFMCFWTRGYTGATFDEGGTHRVNSMGYVGVPSFNLPSDGIRAYGSMNAGGRHMTHIRDLGINGSLDYKFDNVSAYVNYHNEKFAGVLWEYSGTGGKCDIMFVRGNVEGNRLKDLEFFGVDERFSAPSKTLIYMGGGLHGMIYGSEAQAIGFAGIGNGYQTENTDTKIAEWRTTGAAFMNPADSKSTAPRGTLNMRGFMTGVSEDFQPSTPVNMKESFNLTDGDFQLTVDLDEGQFAGFANVRDGQHEFDNMQIGGNYGSTAVSQHLMIGNIGSGTVWQGAANTQLSCKGNAIATDFHMQPDMPWASWGLWVATYSDPAGGGPRYQVVEGMWVAGVKTPAEEVQSLIDNNFSATYTGPARIVRMPAGSTGAERYSGMVNLNISFGGGGNVSGSISAGPIGMAVGGSSGVSKYGFSAQVTNLTDGGIKPITSSAVRGIFCGPNAKGVAGMARVDAGGGSPTKYHATFIGKR